MTLNKIEAEFLAGLKASSTTSKKKVNMPTKNKSEIPDIFASLRAGSTASKKKQNIPIKKHENLDKAILKDLSSMMATEQPTNISERGQGEKTKDQSAVIIEILSHLKELEITKINIRETYSSSSCICQDLLSDCNENIAYYKKLLNILLNMN